MIKSLTVKNFQSHKETHLEFCEGTNVIIGDSDSGKSALLRALYWIKENRPITTNFIRNGSGGEGKRGAKHIGTAEASIDVVRGDKAITISRIRGQAINRYIVGDQSFDALGKDIPTEVSDALRLDKINIQKQVELPYLILESAGTVASTFNKFTNLDKIDEAIAFLSSDLRDAAAEKSHADQQLDSVSSQLHAFDYLVDFEKLVEVKEEIEAEQVQVSAKFNAIKGFSEQIASISEAIIVVNDEAISNELALKKAKSVFDRLKVISDKVIEVEKRIDLLSSITEQCQGAQTRIGEIDVELPARGKEIGLIKKRLELVELRQEVIDTREDLQTICNSIIVAEKQISKLKDEEVVAKDELLAQKKALASVDTCITCGQKLLTVEAKQAMLKAIVKEN